MPDQESTDGAKPAGPIVVAGAHGQSLLLRVDAVPREGETVLGAGFEEPQDGGKATNQAVAAAKLGAPVRLVTLLGSDERGRRWRQILEEHAIDVRYLLETSGATDVGFVMLPPNGVPAIASSRDLSASLNDEAVLSVRDAFTDASIVVCQLEAPQSCALESFRLARLARATTILNPAPAGPLNPELIAMTDVLVPNELEAAVLHGSVTKPAVMASGLARRFGCAVVVTAGPLGCFVEIPGGKGCHCPAPDAQVADTTGAGDAFIGGLAARLRLGDDLPTAAAYAITVASYSVTKPGTMPSYPTVADLGTLSAPRGRGDVTVPDGRPAAQPTRALPQAGQEVVHWNS